MGKPSKIVWKTQEYEEERKLAEDLHVKAAVTYHSRRIGLDLCSNRRKSGRGDGHSGSLFGSATVDIRGRLRIRCTVWWACGCRYDRTYVRQLHHIKDGDQLRIGIAE